MMDLPRAVILVGLLIAAICFSIAASIFLTRKEIGSEVVSFDQELALNSFVQWSQSRVTDEGFDDAIDAFELQVQAQLDEIALSNRWIIVSSDFVVSGATDITQAVLLEVLP